MAKQLMKLVKENIEFERGQDPQVSMGLGLKPEIISLKDSLSEHYDMAASRSDNPYYAGMMEALDEAIQGINNLSIMKNDR